MKKREVYSRQVRDLIAGRSPSEPPASEAQRSDPPASEPQPEPPSETPASTVAKKRKPTKRPAKDDTSITPFIHHLKSGKFRVRIPVPGEAADVRDCDSFTEAKHFRDVTFNAKYMTPRTQRTLLEIPEFSSANEPGPSPGQPLIEEPNQKEESMNMSDVICTVCGKPAKHKAHGMCGTCYVADWRKNNSDPSFSANGDKATKNQIRQYAAILQAHNALGLSSEDAGQILLMYAPYLFLVPGFEYDVAPGTEPKTAEEAAPPTAKRKYDPKTN